jgi:hypothetical protein
MEADASLALKSYLNLTEVLALCAMMMADRDGYDPFQCLPTVKFPTILPRVSRFFLWSN